MYGKSNMETYITTYKIDSQWEFAVWLRKLKQGPCINLEGWGGEGDLKGRGYMYTYGLFIRLVKAMVFPVVIYGCESWTIKKAEH